MADDRVKAVSMIVQDESGRMLVLDLFDSPTHPCRFDLRTVSSPADPAMRDEDGRVLDTVQITVSGRGVFEWVSPDLTPAEVEELIEKRRKLA